MDRELSSHPLTHLVEGSDGGKSERGLGGGAEELQHRHGGGQVLGRGVLELHNGLGRLVDHHLTLVPQARLHKVKQGDPDLGT